ncbi:MAG: hypothetical protein WA996_13130 [Candidatus Promineifilaceae bacterium]
MATETHPKDVDKDRQKMAGTISGGIFLICLGILLVTGWWWPGIMVAIGLSSGAALIFRGKTWRGIGSLAFFCGIAVVVEIVRNTDVDGLVVGAMILIGIGVITLLKALFFRD